MEKRPGARYCDACRARRCPTCRQIGFHVGQHRIGPHRVEPERLDLVSTAELEAVILGAYALAHDRARALVGEQDALDAAHNAIVDVLARRAFLPRVSPWYIVRASVTSALMQLRRDDRLIPVEDPEGIRSASRAGALSNGWPRGTWSPSASRRSGFERSVLQSGPNRCARRSANSSPPGAADARAP